MLLRIGSFEEDGIELQINGVFFSQGDMIKVARSFMDVPHCMGGLADSCLDCSGLVVKVFAHFGIHLPHSSQEQARFGTIVSGKEELAKGDLLFFTDTYTTSNLITHVAIYIENNVFIHTSSNKGVSLASLEMDYWKHRFVFATRVFP